MFGAKGEEALPLLLAHFIGNRLGDRLDRFGLRRPDVVAEPVHHLGVRRLLAALAKWSGDSVRSFLVARTIFNGRAGRADSGDALQQAVVATTPAVVAW